MDGRPWSIRPAANAIGTTARKEEKGGKKEREAGGKLVGIMHRRLTGSCTPARAPSSKVTLPTINRVLKIPLSACGGGGHRGIDATATARSSRGTAPDVGGEEAYYGQEAASD